MGILSFDMKQRNLRRSKIMNHLFWKFKKKQEPNDQICDLKGIEKQERKNKGWRFSGGVFFLHTFYLLLSIA